MKIAYVSQSYPPIVSGAALVVQRLAEGIAAHDHQVTVLTASDRGGPYTEDENGPKIVHMQSYQNPLRVDQKFVLWSYKDIRQKLSDFQPDLLHLHDPLNLGLFALRIAQRLSIPTILTIHQLPWFISSYVSRAEAVKHLVESSAWRYSNWFLNQCDLSITPSRMISDIICDHTDYCPQVISNGVDLECFSPHSAYQNEREDLCAQYQIRPEIPIMLYVGRIDADKQVDLVVKAAAKVMNAMEAQLVVVGDGKQREEIRQLAQSLDIQGHCCFPGFLPKTGDLPGIFRLADVFVTASEIEIQSSVVLEAMASGSPVITVEASSMPEFVSEGESGYLVPPGDVQAMAARTIHLLSEPTKAKAMGQAGCTIVKEHSNKRFVGAHEQLYKSITIPV